MWDLHGASGESELAALRTRLLLLLCSLSLLVNGLYAAATLTRRDYAELGVASITLAFLVAVFLAARHLGWRRWSAILYLFSAILSLVLYLIVNGEAHASISIWIPFIPMLAMLLLDRRDGYWITGLAVMAMLVTVYSVEHRPPDHFAETLARVGPTLFSILLATLATLGVMRVYVALRDRIADRERRERESRATLLNILCHDISNPLTVIRFSADRARRQKEKCRTSIEKIQAATEMIIDMVESVRAMRALEDGKLAVRIQPVDIKEAARQALDVMRSRFDRKEIRLATDWDEKPLMVRAERVALSQTILGNLLSNALKFTPPGCTVLLRITAHDDEAMLEVTDEGIGIPESLHPDLFDPGRHTSRTGTEGEPGTGFGLPLVKKMIDHFGGRIEFRTRTNGPDTGTTFFVHLPRAS